MIGRARRAVGGMGLRGRGDAARGLLPGLCVIGQVCAPAAALGVFGQAKPMSCKMFVFIALEELLRVAVLSIAITWAASPNWQGGIALASLVTGEHSVSRKDARHPPSRQEGADVPAKPGSGSVDCSRARICSFWVARGVSTGRLP